MKKYLVGIIIGGALLSFMIGELVYTLSKNSKEERAIECVSVLTKEQYEIVRRQEGLESYESAKTKYDNRVAEGKEELQYYNLCEKIDSIY